MDEFILRLKVLWEGLKLLPGLIGGYGVKKALNVLFRTPKFLYHWLKAKRDWPGKGIKCQKK